MDLVTLTPPAAEPMTSSDTVLRQHLRLADGEIHENALIDALIAAARAGAEVYTGRRLITQTVQASFDAFAGTCAELLIPVAPVQSVAQVRYVDSQGVLQVLAAEKYGLVQRNGLPRLRPAYGEAWPVARTQAAAVMIDLVVGYGDGVDVPPDIMAALRLDIAHLWQNRESVVLGTPSSHLTQGSRTLLGRYRLYL